MKCIFHIWVKKQGRSLLNKTLIVGIYKKNNQQSDCESIEKRKQ
ncbi:hypothetical protein [Spiroplasma endosymbiont of Virgichneumon dumeticola]